MIRAFHPQLHAQAALQGIMLPSQAHRAALAAAQDIILPHRQFLAIFVLMVIFNGFLVLPHVFFDRRHYLHIL